MLASALALPILTLVSLGLGAPAHEVRPWSQPNARHPSKHDELRALQWGDLNFIHTTDTHGWIAGHMLEREFSGDWGDFVSFTERMHRLADERNVDLIVVDTGDRHDGNGLSDASEQDGSLALPIFCEVDYDVITIGNHELYRGAASLQEFHDIRKRYKDRYVVSNVEIAVGKTWVPLGHKYRVFTTKNQNRTVLALGFLFNFEGNDKHVTRVTKVEDEMAKPWFQHVLHKVLPTVDYVVVIGHIPPRGFPEFGQILHEIRSVDPDIPVSMFGGHSHIRDYKIYDERAVALQSGRYVETIGWASVNLTSDDDVSFARSYIDFNQRTMAFHAECDAAEELATESGVRISRKIAAARKQLNLDEYKATVPQNYYTDRAPFPSAASLYSLVQEKVLPRLTSPSELDDRTRYIFFNTGGIRFDLFKGPYTKDTGYILVPFKNNWFYISDVPREVADQILPILNDLDSVLTSKSRYQGNQAEGDLDARNYPHVFGSHGKEEQLVLDPALYPHADRKRSFGYRTKDDLGDEGDDTVHEPWRFHPIPNAFVTVTEGSKTPESVALVFNDFLAWFIQNALTELGHAELYEPVFHGGEDLTELLPQHFKDANTETDDVQVP